MTPAERREARTRAKALFGPEPAWYWRTRYGERCFPLCVLRHHDKLTTLTIRGERLFVETSELLEMVTAPASDAQLAEWFAVEIVPLCPTNPYAAACRLPRNGVRPEMTITNWRAALRSHEFLSQLFPNRDE